MSAKLGTGLEKLAEKIRQTCGVKNFDLRQPVCFSSRQENLLKKLNKVRSKSDAFSIVTELLDGPID
jgi:hypothetical protein